MLLENGFVKINGASDLEDSSMAAGMCALFNYPIAVNMQLYFRADGMYQRCNNSVYTFSRDQTLCIVAGLYKRGLDTLVDIHRVDGKDWFSPANRGHTLRCKGLTASWFQDLWLKAEILFHAKFTPLAEPNQLICMMMIHPDKAYLRLWCKVNLTWAEAIEQYWCGWRNEPLLASLMCSKIRALTT
jgi:hypothetical protein